MLFEAKYSVWFSMTVLTISEVVSAKSPPEQQHITIKLAINNLFTYSSISVIYFKLLYQGNLITTLFNVSPNEINSHLNTVIVAPMISTRKKYPTRIEVTYENHTGEIAIDQIRTIDKKRIIKRLGKIDERIEDTICTILQRLFAK